MIHLLRYILRNAPSQTYSLVKGIVTKAGIDDPNAHFGLGRYNDVFFHFGYHLYAHAAIAFVDPTWFTRHRENILMLVRNYFNPRFVSLKQKLITNVIRGLF